MAPKLCCFGQPYCPVMGCDCVPFARNSGDGAACVSEYRKPKVLGMFPGLRMPSEPQLLKADLGLRYALRAANSMGMDAVTAGLAAVDRRSQRSLKFATGACDGGIPSRSHDR